MRFLLTLILIASILMSCSTKNHNVSLLNFENSNQRQIEKAINKLNISGILKEIKKESDILVIKSLEVPAEDGQKSENAMVEDIIIQDLISKKYLIGERNKNAVNSLTNENSGNKYLLNNNSTTSLSGADYLLSYRVLEMGIMLKGLDKTVHSNEGLIKREALTKINFRLQNTKTGIIKDAKSITSIISDTIYAKDNPFFLNYHFLSQSNQYPVINGSENLTVLPFSKGVKGVIKGNSSFDINLAWMISSYSTTIGPKVKIGKHINNMFFGGVAQIGFGDDFGFGAGGELAYELKYKDKIALSLGGTAGFWYQSYSYYYSDYNSSDFYFGGPTVNLRIGNSKAYFNFDNSILLGSNVMYTLSVGAKFLF